MKQLIILLLTNFWSINIVIGQNDSGTTNTRNYPQNEKIFVKGSTFTISSPDSQHPQHEVTLNDFYIGKYEVTNAQYVKFLNAKGTNNATYNGENVYWYDNFGDNIKRLRNGNRYEFSVKKGREKYPAEVTWYGAKAYCEWVGGRLPTEAEWEYAARGGNKSKNYKYAGSNEINEVAWHKDNKNWAEQVGQKKPNELGIYDMSGNLWEWCNDWFGKYEKSPQVNPKGPASGKFRVLRGGSWNRKKEYSVLDIRYGVFPSGNLREPSGFRVVFSK